MADWNKDDDVGITIKGYFQIYDGATPYRYKSLQDLIIIDAADSEKYYDDDGAKRKKSLGDSSTWEMRIKKSADLYAIGNAPYSGADLKRISHFRDMIYNQRIIPSATFEGVQVTDATSNAVIVENYTLFVENIENQRNPTTGVPEIVFSGEVKVHNSSKRQTAVP